jgi:hypothetical protein
MAASITNEAAVLELSIDGQPLLWDHDNQIGELLRRYAPLDDTLFWSDEPIGAIPGRDGPRGQTPIGLPIPNYPKPPKLRLNQLYWPTGAARWARGYFLCGKTTRDYLVANSMTSAKTLKVVTSLGTLEASVWVLTPRGVSSIDDAAPDLYIVPVVDQRYWWQFRNVGEVYCLGTNTYDTWAEVFTSIGTVLGITITADTADADYLNPDDDELTRGFGNIAQVLDAAAMSIGQRIVCQPSGAVRAINWTNSKSEQSSNTTSRTPYALIAGMGYQNTDGAIVAPEKVTVTFPVLINGMVQRYDKVHTYDKLASSYSASLKTPTGTVKTIRSTAWAQYATEDAATPSNNTALNTLADQIAADYYDSLQRCYDWTYGGIKEWYFTGYDDHALYDFGSIDPQPEMSVLVEVESEDNRRARATGHLDKDWRRCCTTRIQSSPPNFGVEEQLQQGVDETFRPKGLGIVIAKTPGGGIAAGSGTTPGSATCDLYYINGSGDYAAWKDENNVQETITVYNMSTSAVSAAVYIQAKQEMLSGKWLVDWENC